MCAQIWRTPCLLSTFSTLNFPHYWHLTPNHLQKNCCSTQDMRRKLRKSKHLLHCSCTLFPPGKAVYMPPFTLVAVWLLPRCHLRSINSQSTAVQPCPVTTVWCAASNQSPPPFSPPFIAVHLYTHTHRHSQIHEAQTEWHTGLTHTETWKKAVQHLVEQRITFLKDFRVAQKKTPISATGYLKWLLEWNVCLIQSHKLKEMRCTCTWTIDESHIWIS